MNDDQGTGKIFGFFCLMMVVIAIVICLNSRKSVNGQAVTMTGPMPAVSFYFDSTGAPLGPVYCTILRGTVTTSGTFSLTGTGPIVSGTAAWTNPSGAWFVNDGMMSSGTAVANAYTPYISTFTIVSNAITVAGTAKSPTTLVVLGATAVASTTAEPIAIDVCAN